MCCCCSGRCAKWSTFSMSLVFVIVGVAMAVLWKETFEKVLNHQLSVSDTSTQAFKIWQDIPVPLYLEVHMFNWTNPHLVETSGVKPAFVEMGPYTFSEFHVRENVTFNDNDTLTYLNKRTWRFEPEMSHGSLDDEITVINPIALIITNMIKDEHYIVKRAVNFLLEAEQHRISVRRSIGQLLFDGYDDNLLSLTKKLNISSHVPFEKFGWFVDRNGSATYDGVFNIFDGSRDMSKLGVIAQWNYENVTSYYPGQCGNVNGSSGEVWYAPHDDEEVSIFSPDMCSNVKLHRNGTVEMYGLEGNLYVSKADIFDNGTNDESSKCFSTGLPTGVRGVSTCKFGAPAYVSLPHFHLADPVYTHDVDGMNPIPEIHSTKLALEPSTGIPLRVKASFQLNLLMTNMPGIDMFSNVKNALIPCLWMTQRAQLPRKYAISLRALLIIGRHGTFIGYGLFALGLVIFLTFELVSYKHGWKSGEDKYSLKRK